MLACSDIADIYFKRQKETKGLADAIYRAKSFVGDEPFAILYGDDVIDAEYPVTKQLTDVYEKFGNGVVGVQEVPREDVPKYCTLDVTPLEKNVMQVHDMLEKPSLSEIMSCYSILGRVVMPPEIFGIIENTPPVNGEVGFTAAMNTLAKRADLTPLILSAIALIWATSSAYSRRIAKWACVTPSSRTISRRI